MLDICKKRIRSLRKDRGLTQAELGEMIGVSTTAIGDWEKGKYVPTTDNLVELKKIFGVSVDYILGLSDFHSMEAEEVHKYTSLSVESCNFLVSCKKYFQDKYQENALPDEHLEGFIDSINYFLEDMAEQITEQGENPNFEEIDHLLDEIYQFINGQIGIYHREDRCNYTEEDKEKDNFYRLRNIEIELTKRREKYFKDAIKSRDMGEELRKRRKEAQT